MNYPALKGGVLHPRVPIKKRVSQPLGEKPQEVSQNQPGFGKTSIISLITLVSLGALTALASALMEQDVRITAEENNFTVNKRSAAEAEASLKAARSGANVLLHTTENSGAPAAAVSAPFFSEYQHIAAVAAPGLVLVNERVFARHGIDPARLEDFLRAEAGAMDRARRGETVIRNGAPPFGFPLAALFYPRREDAAVVIFSSEYLADSLGTGINSSWMINNPSVILAHPNGELAAAGVNAANYPFVRALRENPALSQQSLYTESDGTRWFGAYTKLSLGNTAVITTVEYERVFEGVNATTRRNIYLTMAVLFIGTRGCNTQEPAFRRGSFRANFFYQYINCGV